VAEWRDWLIPGSLIRSRRVSKILRVTSLRVGSGMSVVMAM
jgi:hypothetical protein